MGVQPTISYRRIRIIGNACRPKLRALSKDDLRHWNDIELGNILDMAVEAAYSRNEVEEWWEDDSAFGVCLNLVIRVDGDLPAPNLDDTYAVVRHIEENQDADGKTEIIITVIDKYEYEQSIVNGRWKEKRPEKSRYRHLDDPPEQEEDVEIPDGVIDAVKRQQEEAKVSKGELVLIEYMNANDPKTHFVSTVKSGITQVSLGLIANGADPNSIYIWRTRMRVSFSTTLEE
jgi:hypothetical protein